MSKQLVSDLRRWAEMFLVGDANRQKLTEAADEIERLRELVKASVDYDPKRIPDLLPDEST